MFTERNASRPLAATVAMTALVAAAAWMAAPLAALAHDGHDHGKPIVLAAAPATQPAPAQVPAGPVSIVRDPTDLPGPITAVGPRRVKVDLETTEVEGKLADGATYKYWTFNSKVPGPFVRVRVGDTVEVALRNADDSIMQHNVDFHAVTGPGGGARATEAAPGESRGFEFKAMNPGLYVYHCATPMVSQHIANGMYGLILVEPEGGLPKVDHEFYVMQGEIYTEEKIGAKGQLSESYDKLVNERPEFFVFNGAVGALSKEKPLSAKVGETVRIFFGVGGPNYTSSFHVIGEIFDKVYPMGSMTSGVTKDVQTITVPPGGASAVEFKLEVPGNYVLVDHALSRMEKGLVGILKVDGPNNPDVFLDHNPAKSAMSTGGH
ncbi:copper-containing nitrite reductase [Alsobacter sp. SYSU M60028]|uniref:Copper-containing nitrite reductase n=1 Tax=Alsobacter ponti TaxID=2962936 RepID=A0ABT1L9J3_9HYPH|nr:copper-containing nitrite reductase [Alsobacter ponti]MCP8936933.1 copper-containing nitrite reductase [Alsobacter ponti]